MQNCELDLETLGLTPGCVVLSIGAVMFDESGLGSEFSATLSVQQQLERGLDIDPETSAWWSKQKPEARRVVDEAYASKASVRNQLMAFCDWWDANHAMFFWGNGANFDEVILEALLKSFGVPKPWKFWNSRCHRTLVSLLPGNKPKLEGTAHNALDDAKHQARHASAILRYLRDTQGLGGRIEGSANAPLPAYDPRAQWSNAPYTARNLGEDARLTQQFDPRPHNDVRFTPVVDGVMGAPQKPQSEWTHEEYAVAAARQQRESPKKFTPMNFDPVEGGAAQEHPTRIVELPVIAVPLVDEESLGDALARIRKENAK